MRIAVLRIGNVDNVATNSIRTGLCRIFPDTICVVLEDIMPIPRDAYSSTRKQYNSSSILAKMREFMENRKPERILGITGMDLYASRLNFVFGQAECPGRFAIISLSRLTPEFFGQQSNNHLFHERSLKEAVHEVGHTLGLRHCRNSDCVMFFSSSIIDTDRKGSTFCGNCQDSLSKRIHPTSSGLSFRAPTVNHELRARHS